MISFFFAELGAGVFSSLLHLAFFVVFFFVYRRGEGKLSQVPCPLFFRFFPFPPLSFFFCQSLDLCVLFRALLLPVSPPACL